MTTTKMLKQIIVLITSFRAYEWHRLSSIRIILSLKDISLVACRLRWNVIKKNCATIEELSSLSCVTLVATRLVLRFGGRTFRPNFLSLIQKICIYNLQFWSVFGKLPTYPFPNTVAQILILSINFSYPVQRHEMETFSSRFYLQYHEYHGYQAEIPKSCIYFCISCCIGLLVLLLQVIGSIDH